MSAAWVTIGVLAVATAAIKAAGPLALGGRDLPEWAMSIISLLAPALLAALVMVQTFAHDKTLVVDARAAGLAAAAAVLAIRTSILLAGVAAALTAALVRAL
jgi:hypothetical protein